VQYLNLAFAKDMRIRGHKYGFGVGPGDRDEDREEDERAQEELAQLGDDQPAAIFMPKPTQLARKESIEWVKMTLERSRGYELPGTFQPMLISHLFWEQSGPWEIIAAEHVNKVARACKEFVYMVIEHVAPPEFKSKLTSLSVDATLASSLVEAKDELRKILNDKTRHPSTYNHYFTDTIQKTRQRKYQKITKDAAVASQDPITRATYPNHPPYFGVNPRALEANMGAAVEVDMDVFSSQEALDTARAYYKATAAALVHCGSH
jgi:hypothetical protein